MSTIYSLLPDRGLLTVGGDDAVPFLQGLVSGDIAKVDGKHAIYAAFLTAQGKFLHDFFVFRMGDALMLDCEVERAADLARRLSIYKLRSRVTVEDVSADWRVAAAFGEDSAAALGLDGTAGAARPFADGITFVDPRLAAAGARIVLPAASAEGALHGAGLSPADSATYEAHRLALGLPDGSRDLIVEKTLLLEAGFEELNGVDWNKGCFLGQEMTARTHYRGLVKRRLVPVRIEGPAPASGTPIVQAGKEVGEMRSSAGQAGIALLRLDAAVPAIEAGAALAAGTAKVQPWKPGWATF